MAREPRVLESRGSSSISLVALERFVLGTPIGAMSAAVVKTSDTVALLDHANHARVARSAPHANEGSQRPAVLWR